MKQKQKIVQIAGTTYVLDKILFFRTELSEASRGRWRLVIELLGDTRGVHYSDHLSEVEALERTLIQAFVQ